MKNVIYLNKPLSTLKEVLKEEKREPLIDKCTLVEVAEFLHDEISNFHLDFTFYASINANMEGGIPDEEIKDMHYLFAQIIGSLEDLAKKFKEQASIFQKIYENAKEEVSYDL